MSQIAAWLLLLPGIIQVPLYGSPTVVFMPQWADRWVSIPEPHFGVSLVTLGRCSDINGHPDDVVNLQMGPWGHPDGYPSVITVFVNSNVFSPNDVLETVRIIRAGWDHKNDGKNLIYIFEFAPEVTNYNK